MLSQISDLVKATANGAAQITIAICQQTLCTTAWCL